MRLPRFSIFQLAAVLCIAVGCNDCQPPCDHSVAAGQIHSCPDTSLPQGTYKAHCEPGGVCDTGLTCVDDTCLACGADGQPCCGATADSERHCNAGVGCADNGDWPICKATCGVIGKACCDANGCEQGSHCSVDSHACVSNSSATGCGPGKSYAVAPTLDKCAQPAITFTAANDDAALQCEESIIASDSSYAGDQPGPIGQPLIPETKCQDCGMGHAKTKVYFSVYSTDDIDECENYLGAMPQCVYTDVPPSGDCDP